MKPEPGSYVYMAALKLAELDHFSRYVAPPKPQEYLAINGEIGPKKPVNARDVLAQVRFITGTGAKSLDVLINSPGGNVAESDKIYNVIRSFRGPITTRVFGHCASAAIRILLAGTYREAGANAKFCIHDAEDRPELLPPWQSGTRWTAEVHTATAKRLIDINSDHVRFYSRVTGQKPEIIEREMKAEKTISATRAKQLGLIHHVLDTDGITGAGLG